MKSIPTICRRVVVHCPDLAEYFRSYAPTDALDHHVKYATPLRTSFIEDGPILWTGVWSNLPPLVEWVDSHALPGALCVLTNLDQRNTAHPREYGFRTAAPVRIENWTPERHLERLAEARGAIDIKGQDFRARHKPATKAIDCLASGVPLAMNADSSSTASLRTLGFDIATPDDPDRWLSREYWEQTRMFGAQLRQRMSLGEITVRLTQIINVVLNVPEAIGYDTAGLPIRTIDSAGSVNAPHRWTTGHGRIERRTLTNTTVLNGCLD